MNSGRLDDHKRPILGVFLIVSLFGSARFEAAELSADDSQLALARKADALFVEMLAQREKLTSGVARITGSKQDLAAKVSGEVRGLYGFDAMRGSLRYEIAEPAKLTTINANEFQAKTREERRAMLDALEPQLCHLQLWYVRNTTYSASADLMGPHIRSSLHVRRPDATMGGTLAARFQMHDVRALGVMDYADFTSGRFETGESFKDLYARLRQRPLERMTEQDGLRVLYFGGFGTTWTFTVDSEHGYCPVEFSERSQTNESEKTSRVTWESRNGVWVPTTFFVEARVPEAKALQRFSLKYEWSRVNEKIEPDFFEYAALKSIPQGMKIVDIRGDKPVHIGVVPGNSDAEPPPESKSE